LSGVGALWDAPPPPPCLWWCRQLCRRRCAAGGCARQRCAAGGCGLCPRCPGVGRCLSGVKTSSSYICICPLSVSPVPVPVDVEVSLNLSIPQTCHLSLRVYTHCSRAAHISRAAPRPKRGRRRRADAEQQTTLPSAVVCGRAVLRPRRGQRCCCSRAPAVSVLGPTTLLLQSSSSSRWRVRGGVYRAKAGSAQADWRSTRCVRCPLEVRGPWRRWRAGK